MKRKGLPFWGALAILLTAISPNLESASIDILAQPYEVIEPSLLRIDSAPNTLDWSGSLIDFETRTPQGFDTFATGTLNLVIEDSTQGAREFIAEILPTREFTLVTSVDDALVVLDGIFSADYSRALGRVDSLTEPNIGGFFELQAVDLPSSFLLFLSAGGALVLFRKRSPAK